MDSSDVQVPPAPPALSFPQRVIGVFVTPLETFADIARRPAFIAPVILLMLSSFAVTYTISKRIGVEAIVEREFANNPRLADMPSERREQAMATATTFARYAMFASPIIFLPLSILIISGVLLAMGNFVMGGEAEYKQMLAVTAYGMLPGVLYALLAIVLVFIKNPADFDVQNMAATNLALLFDAAEHRVLHRLGASLDLFSFWQIFLLGTGVAAATRISRAKGIIAVAIPWALWVLGAAGLAALRS